MAENLHDQIKRERKAAHPDPETVKLYRRYARGDHDKVASADMLRQAAGLTKHPFADNACGKVLALIASRHELTGFSVDDAGTQKFLDTLFTKTHLADKQYDIHYATIRDGNHAVVLGWQAVEGAPPAERTPGGSGRVTVHRERWWDGTTGMWVAYGDDGEPTYAVKDYHLVMGDDLPRQRLLRTVYFPDHMEKFLRDGAGWVPFSPDDDPTPTNIRWEKRDGTPLGIPVIHFANGSDDDTPYGQSILGGGVIGLQDHLNDLHMDITVAARLTAFPMVTVTGYVAETVNGQALPLRTGPGTVLKSQSPETTFGQVQAGDLTQLLNAHQMKLKAIASNTHTPEHVITGGEWPSGLALIRAEMPLIDLARRLAKTTAPSWETVAHRSTEIANAFGTPGLNEDALIEAAFAPPERLDETAQAEANKLKLEVWQMASTIEDETLLLKSGMFDADEIAALRRERTRRQEEQLQIMGMAAEQPSGKESSNGSGSNGRPTTGSPAQPGRPR